MDKEYDFQWMIQDIDNSLIFMLYDSYDNNRNMASFQVKDILTDGIVKENVKLANVDDLANFVSLGRVRFEDVFNRENIIEIPISELFKLYQSSSELLNGERANNGLYLTDIGAFGIYNNKVLDTGYAIMAYKINEPSEDLEHIMDISSKYAKLGMQEKFNALATLDSLNHRKANEKKR